MSLRGAEDEPQSRPQPRPQAAATAAVLADRMGGLLLHPPSAPLLHVDHGHRAPERTPMDTGVGKLTTPEERALMDKKWAELYESKLDPKDKTKLKKEYKDEGWVPKWNWLRDRGTVAHDAKKALSKQVKAELKQKHDQADARGRALARGRGIVELFQAVSGGGKRAPLVDSSDEDAPLSLRKSIARPRAAADGRGRFQQTVKPVYKEVYYLQWFDDDAWADLPQDINPLHRYYKLDRAALLDPDDPKIRPVVEPSWVGRSTPARADYKEVDWCDNFHCFTTLDLEERVPYIFFEQYESSDGVSIGLPPCRPVYLEQKMAENWKGATKKDVTEFKKGDGKQLPDKTLLPTARTDEDKQSAEQPTLAEMGYYFSHVDQPYVKDATEDRLEFWLNRRDHGTEAAKTLSANLYPNCNALFVDAQLFQEDERSMTGVLPLALRQRLFQLIDGSPFTRVYICDTRSIDHWWYDEESSSDEE